MMNSFLRNFTTGGGATDSASTGSTDQSSVKNISIVQDKKEQSDIGDKNFTAVNHEDPSTLGIKHLGDEYNGGNQNHQESVEFPSKEKMDSNSQPSDSTNILSGNSDSTIDSDCKSKKDVDPNLTQNTVYSSYSDDILNNCRTGDENEDHSNMSIRQNQYNQSNSNSAIKDNQQANPFVGNYTFGMGNILNGGNGNSTNSSNGENDSGSNSISLSHPHSVSSSPNGGDILNQSFHGKNSSNVQQRNEDELRKSVLSELSDLEKHGISLRETSHSGAHSAIPLGTNFYSTSSSSSNNNSTKSSPPVHLSEERVTRDDNHLFYSSTSLSSSYPQLFQNDSKTSNATGTTTSVVSMNKEATDSMSANGNEVGVSTKATSEASSIASTANYMESILNMGVGESYIKSSSSSLQGRSPSPTLGDSQNGNNANASIGNTGVKIPIGNSSNTNANPMTKSIPSPHRSYSTPLTSIGNDTGSNGMTQASFHPSSSTSNIVNIIEDQQLRNVMNYAGSGVNSVNFPPGIQQNLSQSSMGVTSYTNGNNSTTPVSNGGNMNGGHPQRTIPGNNYNQNGPNYHDFNFPADNAGNKPYFDLQTQALLQHGNGNGNGNHTSSLPNHSLDMANWNFLNAIQGAPNNGNVYGNMNLGDPSNGGRYRMGNSNQDINNNIMQTNNNSNNNNLNPLNNNANSSKNGAQNVGTGQNAGNNASNAQTLLMLQALQNHQGLNHYNMNQLHTHLNLLQQQQQQQQQSQQRGGMNLSQNGNGGNDPNAQQINFGSNNANVGNNLGNSQMGNFDNNLNTANGFNGNMATMNGLNSLNFNDLSTLNTIFRLQGLNLGNGSMNMNVLNNGLPGNGNSNAQNVNNVNKGGRGRGGGHMMGNNYNTMKTQNGSYGKGLNNTSNLGGNLGSAAHNSNANMNSTPSSEILEEFRSNSKNKVWDIKDITGHIVEFCQDQHGSRFIQQQLETASDADKEVIFREVLPCASTLMTDVFGNYVVQKILEHGNQDQREKMAQLLKGTAVELALQMYGCRVIQKALEVIGKQLLEELVSEFRGHVLKCVHDQNGNHVIQKCIEVLSMRARESQDDEEYLTDQVDFIVKSFKGQVERFSTHPYGCRVIQRILEHCTPAQKDIILQEIRLCSKSGLVQDQYGNYVIQHVMKHADADDRSMVINEIKGKLLLYSQHKFASNVVEKCLQFGNRQERNAIVDEVVTSVMEKDTLLQVMVRDPFGNYVVQKILDIADDQQQEAICTYLRSHAAQLKKYTYGKHILVRLEKISGEKIF